MYCERHFASRSALRLFLWTVCCFANDDLWHSPETRRITAASAVLGAIRVRA
jgi:hypothetical protein